MLNFYGRQNVNPSILPHIFFFYFIFANPHINNFLFDLHARFELTDKDSLLHAFLFLLSGLGIRQFPQPPLLTY